MLLKSPKYKNNLKNGRKENGMMKKMTLLLAGMMTVSMLGGGLLTLKRMQISRKEI